MVIIASFLFNGLKQTSGDYLLYHCSLTIFDVLIHFKNYEVFMFQPAVRL